ncbi:hypothetical protein AB0C10_37720 [Microbispora amethystogenes]|uniref:hypothetical protein n=1 Tax=Microbispora amethystogenes TaxID=1427754 RepID=UPI0033ED34CE
MTAQPVTAPAPTTDWDRIHTARCELAARVEAERFREECARDRSDYDDYDTEDEL